LADHVQDAPWIDPGSGSFKDAVRVRIEPRLYWRAGAISYTLDGTEPTANSNVYTEPFFLEKSAVIRAAVLEVAVRAEDEERPGPVASARIEVADTTPPTVLRAQPMYGSPEIRLAFSEPVGSSATDSKNYALEPGIDVRSVRKGEGTREVIVELAAPPEVDRTYRLKIEGVKDASPAHNTMKPVAVDVRIQGPVFSLDVVAREQMGSETRDVPGLPIHAKDAWTLNFFVRTEKQPEDRTVIAGFGRCEDTIEGAARYLSKFANGVHFWSRNRDVPGRTPLDLGRWQMLTATYDGKVLRLYKDASKIGEREVALADDENAVRFAPVDPWEKKRRFDGEIRQFTIWSAALSEAAIRTLASTADPR
jgi:alpha-mannosidase